jgi:bifunctional DNA-binding transcriptional regulator/antitoxin component of YhaV-PrlF toxin-antitoxin module
MSVRPRASRKTPRPQTSASSRPKTAGKEARPRTVESEPSKVGKRGTVVISAALRRRYGIKEGAMVIAEGRKDGVLIRPAVILPVEVYTPERKAQFLLSTAVDRDDYEDAVRAVRAMGLDPARIPHYKPPGV